jgi:hypothetical protein
MSNVTITGSLTACNINSVLETVTIKATQIVQSNLNVYDSIAFGSNIPSATLASQSETLKVFGTTGIYKSSGEPVIYTNASGQIGIGSTLAPNLLSLYNIGDVAISMSNANASVELGIATTPGQYSGVAMPGDAVLRSRTNKLHFQTGNGIAAMTVSSNNNIGIGNTNPSSKLDVSGTAKATIFDVDGIKISKTTDGRVSLNDGTATGLQKLVTDEVQIGNDGSSYVKIRKNGICLVGTVPV